VQEGSRPVRQVAVTGVIDDYMGEGVFMNINALHRLMREGPQVSGALMLVDDRYEDDLYTLLKGTPRVAAVTVKTATLDSFNETVAENQLMMQMFNVIFACIIAFGVIYNTARISLSERSRELATLRVIGFTRWEISAVLLGELAVLTFLALPVGMLIGYGFAWLMVLSFDSELYRFPLVISQWNLAFATAVTLGAALISGLIVRRRLDRLNLVSVLKAAE
jgi:putative ABC transport system permease protein